MGNINGSRGKGYLPLHAVGGFIQLHPLVTRIPLNDWAHFGSLHHSYRIGEKGLLFPGKILS